MQVGPAEALGVRARLRDDLHADALVVLIDSQPLWVRLSSPPRPRARPHTTSASRIGHCIVQFRSISCCSLRVDSTALLWFSRIVSNIVHVLGPASSSHSPILTVSTRRFKQKMLRVHNTRYPGRFPGFVRDYAIDFGVRMLHMHNVRAGQGVPPPETIADVERRLLLRIDGRVSSRSLGYRGMGSSRKREPYLPVGRRARCGDAHAKRRVSRIRRRIYL